MEYTGSEGEQLGSTLMRVIRALSASDSGEEREEEKKRLETVFRNSDAKVDQLVFSHQKELTQVMQIYAKVSNRLNSARTRVSDIKESLNSCKKLLHYKRDELQRLWKEGVEQKYILKLLQEISTLKECPESVEQLLQCKKYYEATQNIVKNLNFVQTSLVHVDGIIELKASLLSSKETLIKILEEDIEKILYKESTWEILELHRQSSTRDLAFTRSGSSRGSSGKNKEGFYRSGSGRKEKEKEVRIWSLDTTNAQMTGRLMTRKEEDEWLQILETPLLADPSLSLMHALLIDVECLALLNQLPKAVEFLKGGLHHELQILISRSAQMLIESGPYPPNDNRLFVELFNTVVEQLYLIVDGYRLLSIVLEMTINRNKCDFAKIDSAEIWTVVQTVVQEMLTDYLDFPKYVGLHQSSPNASLSPENDRNINQFFGRAKNQKTKRCSYFRFDLSSTALSLNDYYKDISNQSHGEESNNKQILVTSSNPINITLIYSPLMEFISEIEKALKCSPGVHCKLYAFLMDYIKDVFLAQMDVNNGNTLEAATQALDSWKIVTETEFLKEYQNTKSILLSSLSVKKAIDALHGYMNALPLYSDQFLVNICTLVMNYKEICQNAYKGVIQAETEEKVVLSAQWSKDPDISRYLRALPNWVTVIGHEEEELKVESSQEIDERNAKETQILKENLGDYNIPFSEILSDTQRLRSLAQLQESMEWFGNYVHKLTVVFKSWSYESLRPKLSENSIQTLEALANDFEELGNACLLGLHLEVRVHCFYYLYPIWRGDRLIAQFAGTIDSTDPNTEVIQLTRDLTNVHEALTDVLTDKKSRYIFEGLHHLISAILIASAEYIKKINSNGVKKMCRNIFTIQHMRTSNSTGNRENCLDNAKTYFELLNKRPQEFLNLIVEKGPQFTIEEYAAALTLLHRSSPNPNSQILTSNLEKLSEIMKTVGSSV